MRLAPFITYLIMLSLVVLSGDSSATLYAQSSPCNERVGKVLGVAGNESFEIEVCEKVSVYKEFSYCYGVKEGDAVLFDGMPDDCELVGFTVIRNGVQCGVLCP